MFKYIVVLVLLERRISGEFEFIFLFFVQLIVSVYFNLRFAFHFFFGIPTGKNFSFYAQDLETNIRIDLSN